MAKINLLTLHYAINNGSALQAYATYKMLSDLGHEVTIINLQNRDSVLGKYRRLSGFRLTLQELKFYLFRKKYLKNQTRQMFAIDTSLIPKADYTIVGSDQVWNPDFKIAKNGTYYLNFVSDGSKKIALSSSFGKGEWTGSAAYTESVKNWLQDFSAISVREKAGVDFCRDIFQVEAKQLLDPTLALGDFSELLDSKPQESHEIRCFLFHTRYSLDVIDYISKKESMPVCSVGRNTKKGYRKSSWWKQSPIDWLRMMRDSKIWISDSFHGIACAIILHKQFIALCGDEKKIERLESLLDLLHLRERLVYSLGDLKSRYAEVMAPIDYELVDAILQEKRAEYAQFIKENIR